MPAGFVFSQDSGDVGQRHVELPLSAPEDHYVQLRSRIRQVLRFYFNNPPDVSRYTPWEILHYAIAFGVDAQIKTGSQTANAIGWLCWNYPARGQTLFSATGNPRQLAVHIGPGIEGHEGQVLALLALSKVRRDFVIKVNGTDFTVEDLIRHEQSTCDLGSELTFQLLALSHYLNSEDSWRSDAGEQFTIERLLQSELAQQVNGAACGGTHRLMGISYALNRRRHRDEELTTLWRRAEKYLQDYQKYVMSLQNPDGSFSSNWFQRRGVTSDYQRSLYTSGHIVEWLLFSVDDAMLLHERVLKAVDFLCSNLYAHRRDRLDMGTIGHALRALTIFDERVFGAKPGLRRDIYGNP